MGCLEKQWECLGSISLSPSYSVVGGKTHYFWGEHWLLWTKELARSGPESVKERDSPGERNSFAIIRGKTLLSFCLSPSTQSLNLLLALLPHT